jgi:hypothetical protein
LVRSVWHKGFEQANAVAVGVQAVDVVEHQRLIAVLVGFQVDAKGGGLAADPADLAAQRLADAAGLANARVAEDHQQVQVAVGKRADVAFQFGVGWQADGVCR